ncbi:MAG: FAD-dependent oxidoreductase [Pirellulales bacterium]
MRTWNIGIVGGGPGGLMTAYFLQNTSNSPMRVTMFEASDRLGGKILTPQFSKLPARYEAGAAEFYDYSPVGVDPLRELIEELGLPINSIGGSAVIMDDEILSNLDDIHEQLGPDVHRSLLTFDRVSKDWMSPAEYYAADHVDPIGKAPPAQYFDTVLSKIQPAETRRFLENLIHSDLATEPRRTSVSYGLQNYLMNDPRYMQLYGIVGGNQQLPEELARRIDADKRMRHQVLEVGRRDDGMMVVTSVCDGVTKQDAFDFVVVALPNNYLPTVKFTGERLQQAITAHHSHYNHPAHYLRMTLLFEKPFWRERVNDSYFMLDQFGGCCLYDESSREPEVSYGVLGWLLGGEPAESMSTKTDDELIQSALDSLPAPLKDGRKYFLEGRVHRWLSAVNAMPGGITPRSMDLRHQPEPHEHKNLYVVGDYLFDSTLNGVFDSAEYVAEWLSARMLED